MSCNEVRHKPDIPFHVSFEYSLQQSCINSSAGFLKRAESAVNHLCLSCSCFFRKGQFRLTQAVCIGMTFAVMMSSQLATSHAQESTAQAQRSSPENLIDEMVAARMKLKRGRFHATGEWLLGQNGDQPVQGSADIKQAFDFEKGLVRVVKEAPYLIQKNDRLTALPASYAFIRTPDYSYHFDGSGGVRLEHARAIFLAGPEFKPIEYGQPIDPRTFGLGGLGSIEGAMAFEDVPARLRECKVLNLEGYPQEAQCRLTLQPVEGVLVMLTVLHRHGFVIKRWETIVRDPKSLDWEQHDSGDLKWISLSEAWLPESVVLKRNRAGQQTRLALKFDWQAVNSPLPATDFEVESFGMSPDIWIKDQRESKTFDAVSKAD